MIRRLATVLAALAVLAATGLGAAGSVGPGAFLRTAPLTLLTGEEREPWCDEAELDGADLRGAHFSLSLRCSFERRAVPPANARLTAAFPDLPPAEPGSALLFVQFATRPALLPDVRTDADHLAAWIAVGDNRIDLDGVPGPGEYLVLAVPETGAVVLWVEDAGRAQGLDLRSGERIDPIEVYYGGPEFATVTVEGYEYEDQVYRKDLVSDWWILSNSHGVVDLTRTAWSETLGWAEDGSVYLRVRVGWWRVFRHGEWRLDTERSLTAFDGSEAVEPAEWSVEADEYGFEWHVVEFVVPADEPGFAVLFMPTGEYVEDETGDVFRPEEPAPATEWIALF
ncbi:hypothetical protein [Glycomyces paridis]|uniref:Uncharacterized protein n=1 Tax=Glycomyces paridis TaxID=2126555 RepID=A0A4S8PEX4_9ACTN|nr:hypothetical protein [Glycomyces paridis]THV28960.1 hypothetical protein E9998_09380 [Glycomyces paridis]